MPVYKIEQEMPYVELLKWVEFFKSRPVGYREDYRTFLLLKSSGFKGNAEDIFPSIKSVKDYDNAKIKDDRVVPKGLFLSKIMSAKNGDKLNWNK